MTLHELITVLAAAVEGKTIEARPKGSETWLEAPMVNIGDLAFRLTCGDILRVKREPREGWIERKYPMFNTPAEAEPYGYRADDLIHVREVLP